DLYDLTARVAVRAAIGTVAPGDARRQDLEAIVAFDRNFPIFSLTPQRTDYPLLTLAGVGRLAAIGHLLDQSFDGVSVGNWPGAREALTSLRACAGAWVACTGARI